MNKEKNNSKSINLIELLAILIILCIISYVGIKSFAKYIEKVNNDNKIESKNKLLNAAKEYIENNKEKAPKVIGNYKIITANELLKNKNLKSNLKTITGKSCINNSYVRVYKYSDDTDYSYNAYLNCDKKNIINDDEIENPIVTKFDLYNTNDILETNFKVNIEGSNDRSNPIEIYSYNFTISIMSNDNIYKEVYNSGPILGNNNTKISKSYRLIDYIDDFSFSNFRINFTIINKQGGFTSITKQSKINIKRDINDIVSPKCSKIEKEAKENEWINKHTIENITGGYRKIKVTCDDGEGSGCKKNTFSKSFPNNDIYRGEKNYYWGAEYAYIEVKDNAGNSSILDKESKLSCRVRVNVDILSPRVEVTAIANDNIIKTIAAGGADEQYNEYDDTAKIKANSYNLNNYTKKDKDIWFSKEYKDGIIYKIKVRDNLHLYKYTWETNDIGIFQAEYKKNKNIINNISINNIDGKEDYFPEQDLTNNDNGTTNAEFNIQLTGEGIRYGKLTIYDRAGNKTIIKIYANIDKQD